MENITIQNCKCDCGLFFNVSKDEKQYTMSRFNLKNLQIVTADRVSEFDVVDEVKIENVQVKEIKQ